MRDVLQRHDWHDGPRELGELFILKKANRTARCMLSTHVLGWECRLLVGQELLQSQVCRSQDDVLTLGETWKAAMIGKGWR